MLGDAVGQYIDRVVMMGGKFDALWDKLPFADFNIGADPYAVERILHSPLRLDFVAMNATWPIVINADDIARLPPQSALARHAQDIMIAHCRDFSPEPVFRFHDPTVLVALHYPALFVPCALDIDLEAEGEAFGRLVAAQGAASANAALFTPGSGLYDPIKNELLSTLGFALGSGGA